MFVVDGSVTWLKSIVQAPVWMSQSYLLRAKQSFVSISTQVFQHEQSSGAAGA